MKTYEDQVIEHLQFLQSQGLKVQNIEFGKMVRCLEVGKSVGRGELVYRSELNEMDKGYFGIVTWCRNSNGKKLTFKTYGRRPLGENQIILQTRPVQHNLEEVNEKHEEAAKKACGFWKHSSFEGVSDYLIAKNVGYYGIRFRSSEKYGNVAVVPMRDTTGRIWSYQLLNPDGSKRMPKNSRTKSLFHELNTITNGKLFGVAESYATAATCYELSGVPMSCSFSCENLVETVSVLSKKYPESKIIVFADNDQHLEAKGLPNKGVLSASEAINRVETCIGMAEPEFVDFRSFKSVSDWNDLVQVNGFEFARDQLMEKLRDYF